jgi:hypothetical protein
MVDGCKSWGGGIVFVGVPQKIRGGMKLVRKKRLSSGLWEHK